MSQSFEVGEGRSSSNHVVNKSHCNGDRPMDSYTQRNAVFAVDHSTKTMILRKSWWWFILRLLVMLISSAIDSGAFLQYPPLGRTVEPLIVVTCRSMPQSSSAEEESGCPFVKFYPRYRVDLIGRKKLKQESSSSWFSGAPFKGLSGSFLPLKGISDSLSKSQIQQKSRSGERLIWAAEEDGVSAFSRLWSEADRILQSADASSVVISLPDSTPPLLQNWVLIFDWMITNYPWGDESIQLDATILDGTDGNAGTVVRIEKRRHLGIAISSSSNLDPKVINKRTQSWVKRILVEQGICPFTKSVKMSGQGLADVGVPVGSIAYHTSGAVHPITLFADTFQAIEKMLQAGPAGKSGVSSILLAAPHFDEDFDVWSGPIFTVLEASVVAAMAESQIGVVCFHPRYACPDGSSWPGFGHMHSVTRLEKWYQESMNSDDMTDCPRLSTEDVAAGGEYYRLVYDGEIFLDFFLD